MNWQLRLQLNPLLQVADFTLLTCYGKCQIGGTSPFHNGSVAEIQIRRTKLSLPLGGAVKLFFLTATKMMSDTQWSFLKSQNVAFWKLEPQTIT